MIIRLKGENPYTKITYGSTWYLNSQEYAKENENDISIYFKEEDIDKIIDTLQILKNKITEPEVLYNEIQTDKTS